MLRGGVRELVLLREVGDSGEVEVPAGLQEAVGRTRNEEGTP